MNDWIELADRYHQYLRIEKSFSKNTIAAYEEDLYKLILFLKEQKLDYARVTIDHLSHFMAELYDMGISPRSRARVLAGVRSFFRFLLLEGLIESDPSELLESPKIMRDLPTVLSVEEIDAIIRSIDLSTNEGQRNRAIIETLFSCGLRVSELVDLQISNVFAEEQFIRVIGKGNKQRLVPISRTALREIDLYMIDRNRLDIKKEAGDILFLNRRGGQLTRVMILIMIKRQAEIAGITKTISPHTFRHSFATHLLRNGANLRAIQQMMGHESITTTEIYTHLDREDIRREILEHHPRNIRYGK